jgi:hypothetical protein
MFHLRSIGVLSCAKIFTVVHAVLGILVGFLFLVVGIIGAATAPSHSRLGTVGIIVLAVLMPVFYGVLGFVMGAVWAFVYNLAAQSIGGLELQLDAVPVADIAPPLAAGA